VGPRYLEDLFETMGGYVDSLKFAGGSFTLMPERTVREIVDLCHKHNARSKLGRRAGKAISRCRRRDDYDRERRHY
jgi:phosphosulfolactate synthase (CoM biosynthesis protein A)